MRYLYSFIVLNFLAFSAIAQTDSVTVDSAGKTSFIVAAVYNTNASYYGQTSAEKLPYVLTNASLKFSGGLWLSAGAYKLLNMGSGISAADVSAGIDFDFNKSKSFTGTVSYSRSFYPKNSPLVQAANENSVGASLSYDHKLFSSSLSSDYAFGGEDDLFISFNNSKSIPLFSFSDKDYVSIEPGIEVVAGTQCFYEYYRKQKKIRDELLDRLKDPLKPGNGNQITEVSSSKFDLLSYNFRLPLAYNRSNYLVEGSYQFSLLHDKATDNRSRSFFNLSIYYQF